MHGVESRFGPHLPGPGSPGGGPGLHWARPGTLAFACVQQDATLQVRHAPSLAKVPPSNTPAILRLTDTCRYAMLMLLNFLWCPERKQNFMIVADMFKG